MSIELQQTITPDNTQVIQLVPVAKTTPGTLEVKIRSDIPLNVDVIELTEDQQARLDQIMPDGKVGHFDGEVYVKLPNSTWQKAADTIYTSYVVDIFDDNYYKYYINSLRLEYRSWLQSGRMPWSAVIGTVTHNWVNKLVSNLNLPDEDFVLDQFFFRRHESLTGQNLDHLREQMLRGAKMLASTVRADINEESITTPELTIGPDRRQREMLKCLHKLTTAEGAGDLPYIALEDAVDIGCRFPNSELDLLGDIYNQKAILIDESDTVTFAEGLQSDENMPNLVIPENFLLLLALGYSLPETQMYSKINNSIKNRDILDDKISNNWYMSCLPLIRSMMMVHDSGAFRIDSKNGKFAGIFSTRLDRITFVPSEKCSQQTKELLKQVIDIKGGLYGDAMTPKMTADLYYAITSGEATVEIVDYKIRTANKQTSKISQSQEVQNTEFRQGAHIVQSLLVLFGKHIQAMYTDLSSEDWRNNIGKLLESVKLTIHELHINSSPFADNDNLRPIEIPTTDVASFPMDNFVDLLMERVKEILANAVPVVTPDLLAA
jgi:hypothetical protein